ncbi:MAG: tyrosine--tRNA ligase [Firmicutes bacterium]|jgi:tyrosyl-tRNA synthetase|nr:tyrosine--tRNA ligase [Bacillota bacterium]
MSTQVLSLEEELALITRGTEEIFPEEELVEKLKKARREKRPLKVKLGVDPTGTDLHLGHLIPVLKLKQFQDLGHEAILIIGDYTAMVGDPSGRNKTRPQLTHQQVLENCRTYQQQVFRILDPAKTKVVYNGDWFGKMTFQDVIRLMSQMTLARMLEREDFANRLQNQLPISLHEMIYPLMQGYDSVAIDADVELGGIDQKFNIVVGRELQRTMGLEPQVGVCNPILIGLDGKEKMSKSLGNYIGIDEPAYEMYGKTMSIPDELMMMYFELITDLPIAELRAMEQQMQKGELHPMEAKRLLAREIVARFHSAAAAQEAEAEFDRVFKENQIPDDIPEVLLTQEDLEDGRIWLVRLLVKAGLVKSNGEGRRSIQQGGVRINGEVVDDVDLDWEAEPGAVIQIGKRRFARVRM